MAYLSKVSAEKPNMIPELLAPAGSPECAMAAMNAGADAIYLGLDRFGARAGAENFTHETLTETLEHAHILGRKIYLTVNTLLKDDEIDDLYDLLYEPYINGLDGVIVQDVGVMTYISTVFPKLPIHVSTQAAVTSAEGARMLSIPGVKRIVPARELSLEEIKKLKERSGLEIECFIHGSMCYCYSGRCLLSSFIGGRSGNRGRCAQPCRLEYDGAYLLSLCDMCTIDILPKLIDAGITSFKIEGRMKGSDYVYAVTSVYRKYIDLYMSGEQYIVEDEDRRMLMEKYTRGSCGGYYECHNDRNMITVSSPSYTAGDASEKQNNGEKKNVRLPVRIGCSILCGENAVITVSGAGQSVSVTTQTAAEPAVKRALTIEDVKKQLVRSGNTPFEVTDTDIKLDDGLFLPNGSLNLIRRQGLEAFRDWLVSRHLRSGESVGPRPLYTEVPDIDGSSEMPLQINAAATNTMQLLRICDSPVDGIIIPLALFEQFMKDRKNDAGCKKLYIRMPYIIREEGRANSSEHLMKLLGKMLDTYDIKGFYISNPDSASILSQLSYSGDITGDVHLYAFNRISHDFYRKIGITRTTVPVELNEKELIRRGVTGEDLIIYGRIPVMVSANCIYNTKNGCRIVKEGHDFHVNDRKGAKLFVHADCSECTNIIYNSSIHCLDGEERLFEKIKPSSLRFEFTDETPDRVDDIIRSYYDHKKADGSFDIKLCADRTKGHLKRGVD